MSAHDELTFIERIAAPLRAAETLEPAFEVRLLAAARAAAARGEGPSWQRARHHARHRAWPGRAARWLTARRQIAVSPLAGLAAAAGFAAVVAGTALALSGGREAPPAFAAAAGVGGADGADVAAGRNVVRFAVAAPSARSVALVGDFNGWNAAATPLDRGAVDGLWIVTLPLPEGSYHYAFVIDGTTWTADPAASVSRADEFGAPSSLLTVGGEST